jgi:hypothetical protein
MALQRCASMRLALLARFEEVRMVRVGFGVAPTTSDTIVELVKRSTESIYQALVGSVGCSRCVRMSQSGTTQDSRAILIQITAVRNRFSFRPRIGQSQHHCARPQSLLVTHHDRPAASHLSDALSTVRIERSYC